jgi:multidrug efflux pump subunit AcrA (membrane-fusion protein)
VDLVALDRLVVDVPVPAEELPSLSVGQDVQVQPSAAAGKPPAAQESPVQGKVYFIGAEIDRKTNSVPVSIELPPTTTLRPGQFVRARIIVKTQKDCMAVPRESIIANENGDESIVLVEGTQATHKVVRTGVREGNLVEIIADDLKESDVVVTGGAYSLAKFQSAKVKVLD